jgi:hypothetical protein
MRQSDRRSVAAIGEEIAKRRNRSKDACDAQAKDCDGKDKRQADKLYGLAVPRAGSRRQLAD